MSRSLDLRPLDSRHTVGGLLPGYLVQSSETCDLCTLRIEERSCEIERGTPCSPARHVPQCPTPHLLPKFHCSRTATPLRYTTLCEIAGVESTDYEARKANRYMVENGLTPLLHPVDGRAQWQSIINNQNGRPDRRSSGASVRARSEVGASVDEKDDAWSGETETSLLEKGS